MFEFRTGGRCSTCGIGGFNWEGDMIEGGFFVCFFQGKELAFLRRRFLWSVLCQGVVSFNFTTLILGGSNCNALYFKGHFKVGSAQDCNWSSCTQWCYTCVKAADPTSTQHIMRDWNSELQWNNNRHSRYWIPLCCLWAANVTIHCTVCNDDRYSAVLSVQWLFTVLSMQRP